MPPRPADGPAPAGPSPRRRALARGAALVLGLLVVAYAAMTQIAGLEKLGQAWDRFEWHFLTLPLAATLVSYVTMSLSYEGIVKAAGARIGSADMLRISLVANTVNYLLPSGGLTGFALRLVFFTKRGISPGNSVAISFTQTLLTNLMLVVFVVYGLVHLLWTGTIDGAVLVMVAAATGLLLAGFGVLVAMIASTPVRRRLLLFAARAVDAMVARLGRADTLGPRARRFFVHIEEGMALFAGRPGEMLMPSFWIFLDWLFMMGALWSAFHATGVPVSFSLIAIAFSVSSVASFLTFVPAGAGVLEGSLGGTLAGLGVPLGDSLLPIFLYRVCYFVLPTLLAFALAHGAFTGEAPAEDVL